MTDSTCDIPADLAARLNITVVPTLLSLDGESYRDGVDISREEFYRRLPQLKSFPTTSAPPVGAFAEVFERILSEGHCVVAALIASKLSAIYSAARIAASEVDDSRVKVVESGSVSMGLGWQVVAAAERAAQGATADEVLTVLQDVRNRVALIACLDTLEYLRRSGRVDLFRAGLGALLQIKALIEVKEGEVLTVDRVRTRGRVIPRMVEVASRWKDPGRIAVLHTADWDRARELAGRLAEQYPQAELLVIEAAPVLGSHTGRETLGLAPLLGSL